MGQRAKPISFRLHSLSSNSPPLYLFFFLSSNNGHQPSCCHGSCGVSALSTFSLHSLMPRLPFSFTFDAATTHAMATCRTELDFVVGLDMYSRPSSVPVQGGCRVLPRCVLFSLVCTFSHPPPGPPLFFFLCRRRRQHAIAIGLLHTSLSPMPPFQPTLSCSQSVDGNPDQADQHSHSSQLQQGHV